MMGYENSILVSIYCSRQFWHILIMDCVVPLTKALKLSRADYYIHFSTDQGENVRLTMLQKKEINNALAYIRSSVGTFLNALPNHDRFVEIQPDKLFMNFPNNSIYFGKYVPYKSNTGLLDSNLLLWWRTEITRLICSESVKKEFDRNNLFNFGSEIQYALAFSIFGARDELKKGLSETLCFLNEKFNLEEVKMSLNKHSAYKASNLNQLRKHDVDNETRTNIHITRHAAIKKTKSVNLFLQLSAILFEHLDFNNRFYVLLSTTIISGPYKTKDFEIS
ncbi:hypothetical protein [Pedobacter deserti]|uniref:hypothetical protein n=1 Tax=Pedobacter deserti TaxID=2817382 RepID=UPI0021091A5A|nr:hypothetical protein [Pedobacter sp. SYSU D00382]